MNAPEQIAETSFLASLRQVLGRPDGMVALHEPEFTGNEWALVKDTLDTTFVSSVGKYVDRFEQMLADFTGARHAVAVSNGTSALQVAMMLAGVGQGDEVLVPALSFVATANAVAHCGGIPHFVDSAPVAFRISWIALPIPWAWIPSRCGLILPRSPKKLPMACAIAIRDGGSQPSCPCTHMVTSWTWRG
jgi:hypothetical protein